MNEDDEILNILEHGNEDKKLSAIYHLIYKKESKFDRLLIELINDRSYKIQNASILALGVHRSRDAVPAIIEKLFDDNKYISAAAAVALADIKDESAIDALKEALDSADEVNRNFIIYALHELGENDIPFVDNADFM